MKKIFTVPLSSIEADYIEQISKEKWGGNTQACLEAIVITYLLELKHGKKD